jgi:hypothetical protein
MVRARKRHHIQDYAQIMKKLNRLQTVPVFFGIRLALMFSFFFINSAVIPAQVKTLKWSPPFEFGKKESSVEIIGQAQGDLIGIVPLSGKSNAFVIKRFNADTLSLQNSHVVELADDEFSKQELEEVFVFREQIVAFASVKNRNKVGRSLMLNVYSTQGQTIIENKWLCDMPESRFKVKSQFGYHISAHDSLILFYNEITEKDQDDIGYDLVVFDEKFEKKFEKKLVLPYRSETIEINDWKIDSEGTLWFLTGVLPTKKAGAHDSGFQNLKRHILFSYDAGANKLKEFDVSLKDRWVVALTFEELPNHQIGIGGFYSNDPTFSIAGTFFIRIDGESKSVVSTGLMAFDKDFIRDFNLNGTFSKELNDYYFDYFIPSNDGGAWFLAEQFYLTEQFMMDGSTGRQSISYTYYYNDILVVKVSPEGEILFTKRIPKSQYSINDGGPFLSYSLAVQNDELNMVFYDHEDNTSLDSRFDPRSMSNVRKARLNVITVNSTGELSREQLPAFENKRLVNPKRFFTNDKGTMYALSVGGKQRRILKIEP